MGTYSDLTTSRDGASATFLADKGTTGSVFAFDGCAPDQRVSSISIRVVTAIVSGIAT